MRRNEENGCSNKRRRGEKKIVKMKPCLRARESNCCSMWIYFLDGARGYYSHLQPVSALFDVQWFVFFFCLFYFNIWIFVSYLIGVLVRLAFECYFLSFFFGTAVMQRMMTVSVFSCFVFFLTTDIVCLWAVQTRKRGVFNKKFFVLAT